MKLQHRTRGNAPVKGKQYIFLHADIKDRELRDRVADLILSTRDGDHYAVFYPDETIRFDLDFGNAEFSSMVLYVPLITAEYLRSCPDSFSFDAIRRKGISILPVVEDAGRIPQFNERFDNTHAVSLSMKDPGYEIGIQLDRLLISQELYGEIIRDAFTRMLFISYRKKDKDQIIRIMKAVHNTKWAAAVAFWFDDYLVPGTDFVDGISQAMTDSDAVIMAVTPNLPALNDEGKKNYVCAEEYPKARKLGRKIIAIEALPTEKAQLENMFGEDFPDCIPIDDLDRINEELETVGKAASEAADPYVLYLRAMGFLNGIRVEKDPEKAIELLKECAERNVPEASYQLAYMYTFGIVVPEDVRTAIKYMGRTFEIAEGMEDPEEKLNWMYKILSNGGRDSLVQPGLTPEENDRCHEKLIEAITEYEQEHPDQTGRKDQFLLWKAEMYAFLGSVEDGSGHTTGYHEFSQLMEAERLVDKVEDKQTLEYWRVSGVVNSVLSSYYRAQENYSKALEHARKAVESQEQVVRADPSFDARWQLTTYISNVTGCELFDSKATPVMKEKWKGELTRISRMYEELYAEKKTPTMAAELAVSYQNMIITAGNSIEMAKYVRAAKKRVHELYWDWPGQELKQAEVKIDETMYRIQSAMTIPKLVGVILHYVLLAFMVHTAVTMILSAFDKVSWEGFIKVFTLIGLVPVVLNTDRPKTRLRIWLALLGSLAVLGVIALVFSLTHTSLTGLVGPLAGGIILWVLALVFLAA